MSLQQQPSDILALRASIDNDNDLVDHWPAEAWRQFGTLCNQTPQTSHYNDVGNKRNESSSSAHCCPREEVDFSLCDLDQDGESDAAINVVTASPVVLDCLRRFALRQIDARGIAHECAQRGALADLIRTIDLLHNDSLAEQLVGVVGDFLMSASNEQIQQTFGVDLACACNVMQHQQ